ncbi:MAG: phage holin family protein [Hyphomicrobiaceae bacterium]
MDADKQAGANPRPITDLIPEFGSELMRLVKGEADLLRAEMNDKVDRLETSAGSMAAGGICLLVALLILLQALVVALTKAGLGAGWASLIVGVIVGLVGLGLLGYGRSNIPAMTPRRSVDEVQRTASMAKEKAR